MFTNASTAKTANAGPYTGSADVRRSLRHATTSATAHANATKAASTAGDDPEPVWGEDERRGREHGDDRKLDGFTAEQLRTERVGEIEAAASRHRCGPLY